MKDKIKIIYEFSLEREIESTEDEVVKLEDGSEATKKTKVKKFVPHRFFIRKPNREIQDEADFFYHKKLGEAVKGGILTAAALNKIINNDGGILSEDEKALKKELIADFISAQNDYQRLGGEPEKTEELAAKIKEVEKKLADITDKMQALERKESSIYQNTAEMRAQSKLLFWWMLMLSYWEDDAGNMIPFFGEGPEKDKVAKYDKLEESEDPFYRRAIDKLSDIISVIFITSSFTQEKVTEALKILDQQVKRAN